MSVQMPTSFDYLILGGGCAGLSLAWYFLQDPAFSSKRIGILEKEEKTVNDRTWCFWEEVEGPFESLVFRKWERTWFHGPTWSQLLDLSPFSYKMIQSAEYYAYIRKEIEKHSNLVWIPSEVKGFHQRNSRVEVQTEKGLLQADLVFNSIPKPVSKKAGYAYLYQHFMGWVVETPEAFFDPSQPVLMDFRIDQGGDFRFMYVLPFSPNQALVEYTLFSEQLLAPEAYKAGIQNYLHDFLRLENYSVVHEEFGVIPMFSEPFPKSDGPGIIHIGTAGGMSKASTGYTFVNIHRHSRAICEALKASKSPIVAPSFFQNRFAYYDAIMLDVLKSGRIGGAQVFEMLFKKNPAPAMLRFLDEDSGFLEELKIMNSVPIFDFLRSALGIAFRKVGIR